MTAKRLLIWGTVLFLGSLLLECAVPLVAGYMIGADGVAGHHPVSFSLDLLTPLLLLSNGTRIVGLALLLASGVIILHRTYRRSS